MRIALAWAAAGLLLAPAAGRVGPAPHPLRIDIVHLDEQAWYEASDRAIAREIASPRNSGLQGMSIADIKVPAGVEVKPHYHDWEEVYFVTAGQGLMRVGNLEREIKAGDAVVIPANVWHTVASRGDAELRLIVTCAPSWQAEGLKYE